MESCLGLQTNLNRVILWQYENAPRVKSLVNNTQRWADLNHAGFWEAWLDDVFSLRTVGKFGLNLWARILDILLAIDRPAKADEANWGLGEEHENYSHGNFGRLSGGAAFVSSKQASMLLLLRWHALTNKPTIPNINRVLADVFGPGAAHVVYDHGGNLLTYVFNTKQEYQFMDLLKKSDILPRPAAVKIAIEEAA